jgi:UDP-sugar diphosphatase
MKDIEITPLEKPQFVKTKMVHYTQNGTRKSWEVADVHDSVSILIYHRSKECFIVVKQMRPAIFLKNGEGYTYELCAGICDKDIPLVEIAKEEILEECGYDVPASSIQRLTAFYTAVGFAGGHQTCFYTEVDDSMKVSEGGGIEHEEIEVVEISLHEAKTFIFDETKAKTPGLMFSFMWFFDNKDKKL